MSLTTLNCLNMAEEGSKGRPTCNSDCRADKNLEQFICYHYQQEKDAGKLKATEELDEKRIHDFFLRALAESRRMNEEVMKSRQKNKELHEELGGEKLAEWRDEHAAETLLPEQADRIRLAHQYC